jgi:hypothetical protein
MGLQCASIEQLASLFWARPGAVGWGDSTCWAPLVSTAEWETGRASTRMRRPIVKRDPKLVFQPQKIAEWLLSWWSSTFGPCHAGAARGNDPNYREPKLWAARLFLKPSGDGSVGVGEFSQMTDNSR